MVTRKVQDRDSTRVQTVHTSVLVEDSLAPVFTLQPGEPKFPTPVATKSLAPTLTDALKKEICLKGLGIDRPASGGRVAWSNSQRDAFVARVPGAVSHEALQCDLSFAWCQIWLNLLNALGKNRFADVAYSGALVPFGV
eukprot:535905-Amphidinium_carterae.1